MFDHWRRMPRYWQGKYLGRTRPATNLEAALPPLPSNYVTELWRAIIKSIPLGISSTNNNWNYHNLIGNFATIIVLLINCKMLGLIDGLKMIISESAIVGF